MTDKYALKELKAMQKAAKAMFEAADALGAWYSAAGEAGSLTPNSREGRDTRLIMAADLREYASYAEGVAERKAAGMKR